MPQFVRRYQRRQERLRRGDDEEEDDDEDDDDDGTEYSPSELSDIVRQEGVSDSDSDDSDYDDDDGSDEEEDDEVEYVMTEEERLEAAFDEKHLTIEVTARGDDETYPQIGDIVRVRYTGFVVPDPKDKKKKGEK